MDNEARETIVTPSFIAVLCEGAVYCPDHTGTITQGDLDDSHVLLITQQDYDFGTEPEYMSDACCSVCTATWDKFGRLSPFNAQG